jgi:hypothetical protein
MYLEGPCLSPAFVRRCQFILFLFLLLSSLCSSAQVADSPDLPVLWLRADSCVIGGSVWKDVTGHGYDGAFFGSGPRKAVALNYNPAIWFNGVDDSVRVSCNLDSLSEMTYMAVFVPADDVEEAVWGTGAALLRNTLMSTRRMYGPDSTADTLATAAHAATLATVLQTWQRNDSVAPSAAAYMVVGKGGVMPPFKGALAELLVFDRSLDVLTQVQYETYLAIKYGIPLVRGNYVSAGQVVVWDALRNKGYAGRIAGLGRESYFMLNQRKSISAVDADSLLIIEGMDTIGMGNYLVWGDNNKGLALSATPDGQLQMVGRQWLMSVSGGTASKLNTAVRFNRGALAPNSYWLVVNPGGYAGFPVDSLSYYFADSLGSDSPLVYRNIHWDVDHSGKDLFGLAQARDLLLKLHVLDSPTCENPGLGRVKLEAVGGTGPYSYRITNAGGEALASGMMDSSVAVGGLGMGNYSVLLMDDKGHSSLRSLSMWVPKSEQLSIALAPNQTLPVGGSLVLDASAEIESGAVQGYQWVGSNGFTAVTPSVSVGEPGVYSVAVTSVAGCVFRDTVTVSGDAGQRVGVYPSPSVDGNFTVSVSLPEAGPVSVGVYDLGGNKLQEMAGHNNSEYRLPGHLSTPGVYMIMVKTSHGVESRKLMIL